jgi:hypothetical protein
MNTNEHVRTILGVEGRAFARHVWPASTRIERAIGLWSTQTWGATRYFTERGRSYRISVDMRFDDNCKNGHHTFAITGEVREPPCKGDRSIVTCGAIHEEIAKHFPELAPLIKWHLTSTDGPMHYVANAMHFASDRDCWGRRKGDPSRFETFLYFSKSPVGHAVDNSLGDWIRDRMVADMDGGYYRDATRPDFEVRGYAHERDPKTYGTHYTLALEGAADEYVTSRKAVPGWAYCPFRERVKAEQFALALNTCRVEIEKTPVEFSEGKARELDLVRAAAVWPEATDAELMQEPEALKAVLLARMPGLIAEFRTAMVDVCGFAWSAK